MKTKIISLFLAFVMVFSVALSIASLAFYASFSGLYNDFVLFTNDTTYGSLTLRITQSGEIDDSYFEAEGKYKWAVQSGTTDQLQNHSTLKIKGTVICTAYLLNGSVPKIKTSTFYGNNISTTISRTITAFDDADGMIQSTQNEYKYTITSTMDSSLYFHNSVTRNLTHP